jgi:hypothetical protein
MLIRHSASFPLPMRAHVVAMIGPPPLGRLMASVGLTPPFGSARVTAVGVTAIAGAADHHRPTAPPTPKFSRLRSHRLRTRSADPVLAVVICGGYDFVHAKEHEAVGARAVGS